MASAFDEGMAFERQGMDLVRGHLYGGKPITDRTKARGVALLQQAFAAYDRDEKLGGIDAGLLDVDAYRARQRDRSRVEGELRRLGARTFAGPPPLNTYEEAFAIVSDAEGNGGKGRAKVRGAARVRILDVDNAPDRIVVEVIAGSGAPVGHRLTLKRSELYALRFEDEQAAFGALVKKLWPSAAAKPSKPAKRPTFADGRARLMALMDRQMWIVTTYARGHDLKVPYATDSLGTTRVWFHPQTLYIQTNDSRRDSFDAARASSTGVDLRDEPEAILAAIGHAPQRSTATDDIPPPAPRPTPPPPPVVRPAGFGVEETAGKRKGQLRMFNPRRAPAAERLPGSLRCRRVPTAKGKKPRLRVVRGNPGALRWLSYVVDGRPSLAMKEKTEERSGAYAIRRKDSHGVVYVGESHQGHLWRTIARHFQSPATFTAKKKPGGANAFATDRPEDYEVAFRVTSRGYRDHAHGDQRAMGMQARWIRDFIKAGHRLHNRDDGMSAAAYTAQLRKDLAARDAEDAARGAFDGLLNPGSPRGALTMLGLLTGLETSRGLVIRWSLKDAPWLAYDAAGRLRIVYPGRVVRGSTDAEIKEYKRTHWDAIPVGKVRSGGVAVAPFVSLGDAVRIVYTTKKGSDAELVDYVHPFGKRGGAGRPQLVEHRCAGGCVGRCGAAGSLALAGGSYRMTVHGIVG